MNINHALSVRSDFSIGQSLLQVEHIIQEAKTHGYESVALVDDMSIHNLVDFSNQCKAAGIKPIIGCRLRVADNPLYRLPSKASGIAAVPNYEVSIKVYVTCEAGITSLLKVLSKANSAECFYYHSRVGWSDIMEMKGVIIATGDFYNLFHHPKSEAILHGLMSHHGAANVFVELVPVNTPLFDTLNAKAITAAEKFNAQTLATYPFMYRKDEDASSLDVLGVITSQSKMSLSYRPKQRVTDFGFRPPAAIVSRIASAGKRIKQYNGVGGSSIWKQAILNIEVLAGRCEYEFKKYPVSLPVMAANEFETLGRKCIAGWKKRFAAPILGHMPEAAQMDIYKTRLSYELGVLKKMGFAGYFLLVEDLVVWAKENGIFTGPGRGSVGGSLVAYLIGITDVDPIRFNLIFERFINPDRLDLPDADLDFMSTRRFEIVTYLSSKYGADRVAGISNFSSLASASALRDTGRVHDMSGLDLMATKLVPKEHGQSLTLTDSAKAVPELDNFKKMHPEIWGHALKLEGVMRAFGRHAAGVIVAGEPLIGRAVIETRASDDGVPVVNWDKRSVEDFGLVKMDILGLSTLDVLEIAKLYIKERHGRTVNYLDLPLDDADIMQSFGRGDTTGVFQFDSAGIKKLLRDLAVGGQLTFEDITAATALYRPGPMDSGLMADFINIKQGTSTAYYEHPNMEPALRDTGGVIVYQEQVMQIARDVANYSMADADKLRKIMGKKNKDDMAKQRQYWIDGCAIKSGMLASQAGDLFDKIEAFAGYGFNKSHATAYSILSYWTMWVRVRYPAEYFAACLSIVGDDKLTSLVNDARQCGIEVLPPDINQSSDRFTIPNDKHLLTPFGKIKGCSDNTARRIVALRNKEGGSFRDVEHFESVMIQKGSKINIKVRENLDKIGGLVSIQPGAISARDTSRRKDQIELMPGLILDSVKSDRQTDVTEKFLRAKIIHVIQEYRGCKGCDLAGQPHPSVRMKSNVKFMVVTDCPSWQEEKAEKLMEGEASVFMKEAIKAAGLEPAHGYYTTLVKAKKSDKFLTNGQINGCSKFLEREIELIKPSIIIAMGTAAIKRFVPGIKGSTAELVGKVIYDSKLDASIVCGFNVQQIAFDPDKFEVLKVVFEKVADMLN